MSKPSNTLTRAVFMITCAAISVLAASCTPSETGIIRLQVVANSNCTQDQLLKLKVRDEVLKLLAADMSRASSPEVAAATVTELLPEIANRVRSVVQAESPDTSVTVEFGTYSFPEKQYGGLTLPAGDYQALRVVLGKGAGENWWCVLFPPLCLVDVAGNYQLDPEKIEILKKALEIAYNGGAADNAAGPPQEYAGTQVRFALVNLLERTGIAARLQKLATLFARLGH